MIIHQPRFSAITKNPDTTLAGQLTSRGGGGSLAIANTLHRVGHNDIHTIACRKLSVSSAMQESARNRTTSSRLQLPQMKTREPLRPGTLPAREDHLFRLCREYGQHDSRIR